MGELIREARRTRGMSQDELGRAVGVTQQSVSGWEKGTVPDPATFNKVCGLLGIIGAELLTAAGYDLGADATPATTETAIRRDQSLDPDQRRFLIAQYRTYQELNSHRQPGPT